MLLRAVALGAFGVLSRCPLPARRTVYRVDDSIQAPDRKAMAFVGNSGGER